MACDGDVPLAETESDQFISYEDYKRLHTTQLSDGSWVVESDISFDDEDGVRRYYDRLAAKACEGSDECLRAMVLQDSGADDEVWSPAEKLNLTYCIADLGSTSNY
ncbi:MAG TPA: hypothetical protein VM869_33640, partial [Enhygromyxa sp.]|nr:hypothetical protein [Enhygromyxa sp.]